MADLTNRQMVTALRVARELAELQELSEFPRTTARLLRQLIACDHAGFNAIELGTRRATVVADPPDVVFEGGPEVLARFAHQSPLVVRASGGETAAMRLSDGISRRDLHRTDLYQYVYRTIGLEFQLAVQLATSIDSGHRRELVGLSLARHDRDFTERHLALLDLLRPVFAATLERLQELALLRAIGEDPETTTRWVMLVDRWHTIAWSTAAVRRTLGASPGERLPAALRAWLRDPDRRKDTGTVAVGDLRLGVRLVPRAYPELDAIHLTPLVAEVEPAELCRLGLTRRQAAVLAEALRGRTSPEIAERLELSTRTVEKHFDAIYARLGVRNRSEAILATIQLWVA